MVISRENRDLIEKSIKSAVWHMSSKINRRVKPGREDDETIKIWSRIQRRIWSLQKNYILLCRNKSNYNQFINDMTHRDKNEK